MRRPWRTTFGLTAMVSLIFALATVVIGVLAYAVVHEAMEVQLDHRIATETRALLARTGNGGTPRLAALIQQRDAAHSTASLGYILLDPQDKRLAGAFEAQVPATPGYVELLPYGRDDGIAQSLTTRLPDGSRLLVAGDRQVIDEMDITILKLFLAAFAYMLLLAVGGAWTVGVVTQRRLRRFDDAAQVIIAGDLHQRMPLDGSGSEFDRVAETLNHMLDRNAALVENLRQVSSDVAHDLRTPLTRVHNRLHEALTREGDERIAAIEAASTESRELLELFAAILRISEVEAGTLRRDFRNLSMTDLVDHLVDSYNPDFEISAHRLSSSVARDLNLHGDRRLLRQLVANLLDNALRHTPYGTRVSITLSPDEDFLRLCVHDDGPGVPEEDIPRLFDRFSRSEASRSTDGHGLGLALVAAVARMHGGSAAILPASGFGIEVRLARRYYQNIGTI
ncbi:two-component sensor histidine kinase [Sphingobium lactosutens]|uniref:sensor histidine kinase n=1 Tax=Sphingobium lactosutens TaxID=522773 RepID=UPI0015BCE04A|nr:ATP-binding protein [Sphingobium lactosutens]NWK96439.1 two-component sensor histidine kinase [Sphingobium lactosutens]